MIQHWESRITDTGLSYQRGEDWREEALCAQVDPELWYPEKGETPNPAKRICAVCPSRRPCLEDAMRSETGGRTTRFGVSGGLSSHERAALHKSGWLPGDPLPPVVLAYGGHHDPGKCESCGERFESLSEHALAMHPEVAA